MKRRLLLFLPLFLFFLLVFLPLLRKITRAASTDAVTATVTAQIYSVSVSDGTIAFGTVAQNSTQDTTTAGVNDSQTATNDGTVAAKFNIKAADSTGGAGWTLAGTAASETYTMKSCTATCDTTPTWTSVGIDPSYATLVASVAASGNQVFDLQVGTPVSTAETTEQSITVTIQATTP